MIFHYIFIGVVSTVMNAVADSLDDASSVTWAHAVNSRKRLEEALAGSDVYRGDINFLEADVSLGNVTGPNPEFMVPIMAHPPSDTSDISLDTWIQEIISVKRNKGVKLDFKFFEIVEVSLKILRDHEDKITFPLWLNADILPGPVDPVTVPVNSSQFLSLCQQYFPQATLSVGWTTLPFNQSIPGRYTWKNVKDMAEILECSEINQPVTFPVRAIFVGSSLSQLVWLLDIFPASTLTVWSATTDFVSVDSLLKLRSLTSRSRVYYDLPGPLNRQFHDRKDSVQPIVRLPSFISYNYTVFGGEESCTDKIYVTPSTILFTGQEKGIIFHRIFTVGDEVHINGTIDLFSDAGLATKIHLIVSKANSFPHDFGGNIIIPSTVDVFPAVQNSAIFSYTFSNSLNTVLFKLHLSVNRGTLSIITGEAVTTDNFNYTEDAVISFISVGGPSVIYDGNFDASEISNSDNRNASLLLLTVLLMFLYTLCCSL